MCLFPYQDELARQNGYSAKELIQAFSLEDIRRFIESLGVDEIEEHDDYLICPTICHNPIDEAESMKLYYYSNTKNFHCYTECSENFSVISLYQRYMEINHQEITFNEAVEYLRKFLSFDEEEGGIIVTQKTKYLDVPKNNVDIITLPEINKNILDAFVPLAHPLWLTEGITEEAQSHFDIRFSYQQNQIVIPHYDINGHLVGIRGRAIDEEDLIYGKYHPISVGQNMYNHQLGFNLYGIWEHQEAIRLTKRVVIYEGEKSVMLDDSYYGKYSIAVATCGSQLNKFQINLLIKCLGVNQIILAYDKEYDSPFSEEGKKYRQKLIDKCRRYYGLADFYYIFDEHGLLNKKDAPCDRGMETLEKLMKRKIKIK